MRKAVLIMLLALAGNGEAAEWADWLVRGNAFGEWVVVDRKEGFIVYANTGTIRTNTDIAQMWGLTDFVSDTGAPLKGTMSLKMEREYDCSRQQMRILYISRHSETWAKAKLSAATPLSAVGSRSCSALSAKGCGESPAAGARRAQMRATIR